ncbi:MAG: hypothetical protein EA402_06550 [Planctomycetota bacterium]|nr:MAG: hypothetical protein EA402_06550 [Planctomycetota bacterium]
MTDTPADAAATPPIEEWKPEPRTWVWKDLFTAPMLAFKPKCMLISAITLAAIGIFTTLWGQLVFGMGYMPVITPLLAILGLVIAAAIFSLGATLVSTFMKADLLDDEFLSLREALGQFRKRVIPAVMVPSFLILTVFGFIVLLYLAILFASIPRLGPIVYMALYPLGFILSLLTVLLIIAMTLASFLFPAIVSVRKHGWFDNVIDTFEAVGTKPHVVVLNWALIGLIASICVAIGFAAMGLLFVISTLPEIPGMAVLFTEMRSNSITFSALVAIFTGNSVGTLEMGSGFYDWFVGLFLSFWKIPIAIGIIGYGLNVVLAGGMLTYLYVREDDYWDDEDLEDLDKLAKELEEEAKAEAAKAEAEASEPAPAKPAEEIQPEAASETESASSESSESASESVPEAGEDNKGSGASESANGDEQKPS